MKDDKTLTIDEFNNIDDKKSEPDFNESVGKFIQKIAQWAEFYDGDPRPGIPVDGYHVTVNDLLNDLILFADDVFDATIERDSRSLRISFTNGQIFRFIVEDETPPLE